MCDLHSTNSEETDQPDLLPHRYLKRYDDWDGDCEHHEIRNGSQSRRGLVYSIPINALRIRIADVPRRSSWLTGEDGDERDGQG